MRLFIMIEILKKISLHLVHFRCTRNIRVSVEYMMIKVGRPASKILYCHWFFTSKIMISEVKARQTATVTSRILSIMKASLRNYFRVTSWLKVSPFKLISYLALSPVARGPNHPAFGNITQMLVL